MVRDYASVFSEPPRLSAVSVPILQADNKMRRMMFAVNRYGAQTLSHGIHCAPHGPCDIVEAGAVGHE